MSDLVTQAKELVKQKIMYDASNRPEYVYTAQYEAEHGTPCTVTRYAYDGTSVRVIYMRESTSTWNSAWEAF
jgi:hypothetical protein